MHERFEYFNQLSLKDVCFMTLVVSPNKRNLFKNCSIALTVKDSVSSALLGLGSLQIAGLDESCFPSFLVEMCDGSSALEHQLPSEIKPKLQTKIKPIKPKSNQSNQNQTNQTKIKPIKPKSNQNYNHWLDVNEGRIVKKAQIAYDKMALFRFVKI